MPSHPKSNAATARSAAPEGARPPRRRSLAEGVVETITERIREGVLKPGDRLPTEPEMTAEFAVSRTVVREAISRLQAGGLVETRHGVGTFVLDVAPRSGLDMTTVVTIRDVVAMLELRISLETESAALAAARASADDVAAMREALADFAADAEAGRDGVAADVRFHLAIARATRNRYFESVLRNLGTATLPRTRLDLARIAADYGPDYLARTNREHEAILEAIARGDADAARAAMRMHLSNSRERLRRASGDAEPRVGAERG